MRRNLIFALEELEPKVVDEPKEEGDLDVAMLAVMEDEQELTETERDMEAVDDTIEEAEVSTERLNGLIDAITKHGICTSMMIAVDPQRELVTSGIAPAYEELEDAPVKDENAESTVDGLKKTTKAISAQSASFFGSYGSKMSALGSSSKKALGSYSTAFGILLAKLEEEEVKEEELGESEAAAMPAEEFLKMVGGMKKAIAVIGGKGMTTVSAKLIALLEDEAIDPEKVKEVVGEAGDSVKPLDEDEEITGAVGKLVKLGEDGSIEPGEGGEGPEVVTAKMSAFGWTKASILNAIKEVKALADEAADVVGDETEAAATTAKAYSEAVKGLSKKMEELPEEKREAYGDTVEALKMYATCSQRVMRSMVKMLRKTMRVAMTLGKTASKCK
jgi:hypothetical protein